MRPSMFAGRWLQYTNATVNVVMDGNSLVYGYRAPGPGTRISDNLASQAFSPLYGQGMTVGNVASSGQTWADMLTTRPTFVAGKRNICIAWEGTNSIVMGLTASQAMTDAAGYCAAMHADNAAWEIVTGTCIPRQGGYTTAFASVAALNAELDAYNTLLKAQYASAGFVAVCDVRAVGSPWAMGGDYSPAGFAAVSTRAGASVWLESTASEAAIHMTDAGDLALARLFAATLARIR